MKKVMFALGLLVFSGLSNPSAKALEEQAVSDNFTQTYSGYVCDELSGQAKYCTSLGGNVKTGFAYDCGSYAMVLRGSTCTIYQ